MRMSNSVSMLLCAASLAEPSEPTKKEITARGTLSGLQLHSHQSHVEAGGLEFKAGVVLPRNCPCSTVLMSMLGTRPRKERIRQAVTQCGAGR